MGGAGLATHPASGFAVEGGVVSWAPTLREANKTAVNRRVVFMASWCGEKAMRRKINDVKRKAKKVG